MSELKAGDTIDFQVGGQTLTVEPVPFGNLKKILKVVMSIPGNPKINQAAEIPALVEQYVGEVFPLFFIKGKYDFITETWIEENMTVPKLRKILEAAIVVNALQDFFEKLTGKLKIENLAPGSPSATPTPPEKVGSTTSAGSPTDGGPKT